MSVLMAALPWMIREIAVRVIPRFSAYAVTLIPPFFFQHGIGKNLAGVRRVGHSGHFSFFINGSPHNQ
jgi:hypothetical protein